MSRSTIKWTPLLCSYPYSEKVNKCSFGAEALYTRLLAQSDINGNFYGDTKLVASRLFGYKIASGSVTEEDVANWISELELCGLIVIYWIDGSKEKYIHIVNVFKTTSKQQIVAIYPPGNFAKSVGSIISKTTARDGEYEEIAGRIIDLINKCYADAGLSAKFSKSKTNIKGIVARLREGAIEEELAIVVKHKATTWLRNPESIAWFNPTTMFRPTKFENNLNAARVWSGKNSGKYYRGKADETDYGLVVQRDN